jgi:altronate hydrolase
MSLVEIAGPATPANAVIHLNRSDNIAVARVPLAPGQTICPAGAEIRVREEIPVGHKVALRAIAVGERILRYGQTMGRASRAIEAGEHVHVQNVVYEEAVKDYEFPALEIPLPERKREPVFLGYPRADGRVGTRNYIAVVAASNCSAHAAERAAAAFAGAALPENVDGVVAFPHGDGCGHALGPDFAQFQRTIGGVLDHPNVSAALIVGLGCETNQIELYVGEDRKGSDRLAGLTIQGCSGTSGTVEAARKAISKQIERAAAEKRIEVPASRIVLGLNCGGSDSFSGITANPALGVCSDLLAAIGGTPVLAETPETFGAEHLLVKRARSRAVAEKLLAAIRGYHEYLACFGECFNDNPSPGNKAGGITNILEKSLGAVAKGGSSTLMDVYEYAERITAPGLGFMNTPGYDPPSLAGLAAGGVNVIAFTTGRGSAIGFPTVPVIKIATNSAIFGGMRENMDVNAGRIADGTATLDMVGREIFDLLLRVASGEKTASERLGHHEFVPWRIGPVM